MGAVRERLTHAAHLVRRFVGSLRPGGPRPVDEAWAVEHLAPGECALWRRMSDADRRHACGVARRAAGTLGDEATHAVVAAALLHDVGKVESALGTFARVLATVVAGVPGRHRLSSRPGRIGRYLRHDELGAALLEAAGSDPLTVAWAREHHRAESTWTLPPKIAAALKTADDD